VIDASRYSAVGLLKVIVLRCDQIRIAFHRKTLSIRHNRVYGSYPRGIEYIWEWANRFQ
jgi:hypothetical protein